MRERIERILRGDRDAFSEIIELFEGVILAYAHHLSGSSGDAEEIAQETFVRAYRTLDRLQDPDRFGVWLKGISKNIYREICRKRQDDPGRLDPSRMEAVCATRTSGHEWLGGFSAAELFDIVSTEIQGLEEPHQVVLTLRHFQKLSCREIGARLGVPVGTVTMRLSRAHRRLRETLIKQLELSDGGSP